MTRISYLLNSSQPLIYFSIIKTFVFYDHPVLLNFKHPEEITGKGAHYSFETTGVPEVTLAALRCLRVKGVCATVAVGKRDLTFNVFNDVVANALTLTGVIEGDAVPQLIIPKLVTFFKNGQFPIEKMVKFYELEDVDQASTDSSNGSAIKPILIIDKEYQA